MSTCDNKRDEEALFRTMRDIFLESKPEEVKELAAEADLDFEQLAKTSRAQVVRALKHGAATTPPQDNIVALHKGLYSLLVMLRRRDGLDETELARKAGVDEKEVHRIECDPGYIPSPRTIFKLEQAFALPTGVIARLSGAVTDHSPSFEERVTQFAANAKAMGKLTRSEHNLLNAFVQYLADRH